MLTHDGAQDGASSSRLRSSRSSVCQPSAAGWAGGCAAGGDGSANALGLVHSSPAASAPNANDRRERGDTGSGRCGRGVRHRARRRPRNVQPRPAGHHPQRREQQQHRHDVADAHEPGRGEPEPHGLPGLDRAAPLQRIGAPLPGRNARAGLHLGRRIDRLVLRHLGRELGNARCVARGALPQAVQRELRFGPRAPGGTGRGLGHRRFREHRCAGRGSRDKPRATLFQHGVQRAADFADREHDDGNRDHRKARALGETRPPADPGGAAGRLLRRGGNDGKQPPPARCLRHRP